VITTPPPLAAALALLLPALPARVERKTGPVDPRLGVFFAVPFVGQLDLHVLRDGSARASLEQLALFAAAGFTDVKGQISPDVYWWRAGRVERITHLTPQGVAIIHRPELDAVLDELSPPRPLEVGSRDPTA
ncbi:MAG: hypothetical protein M3Y71_05255, partial [Actinomycetota bacterium]|nr:hypothetical protein [Actinomycetota bacterium]